MCILLSYDGSDGAEQAVTLAAALRWPADWKLRIVSVVEPRVDAQIVAYQEDRVADAVRRLRGSGGTVEGAVLRGRPATVLVDEAARLPADLVICGSRGHGPIASLVLGSVSAEVVDHAPCPVLVARTPAITRILFASDGSAPSAAAEAILARWPFFESLPIRVVSVVHVVGPWHTGIAPTMYGQVIEAYQKDLEVATSEHTRIAEEASARLRSAGREVEPDTRTGDAAGEIIAAAEESAADMVVIGSRGRTGLARLVLGSVARNVLHGSRASVLVVHQGRTSDGTPP